MIVLYNCPGMMSEDAPQWRALLTRLVPDIDFRVWPDIGRAEEIEFILAWKHKPGDLKRYPNAKAIFWLGAGVDHLVKDPDLPRQMPIVRLVDDGLTRSMTEYVVQHVLHYHRRQDEFDALQRRREWNQLVYPLARHRKVGLLGLGVLGSDAAEKLLIFGFDVASWTRSPKSLSGRAELPRRERLPAVPEADGDPGLHPAADAGNQPASSMRARWRRCPRARSSSMPPAAAMWWMPT